MTDYELELIRRRLLEDFGIDLNAPLVPAPRVRCAVCDMQEGTRWAANGEWLCDECDRCACGNEATREDENGNLLCDECTRCLCGDEATHQDENGDWRCDDCTFDYDSDNRFEELWDAELRGLDDW